MGIFFKKTRNLKNKKTLNLKKSHKITQNVSYHYFKSIKKSLIPFERICKCILNGGFWQNPSFPRPLWNCAFSIRKKLIDKLFLNNTHSLKKCTFIWHWLKEKMKGLQHCLDRPFHWGVSNVNNTSPRWRGQ